MEEAAAEALEVEAELEEAEEEEKEAAVLPPVCRFLTIPFFEEAMNAAHAENVLSPQCGRDVWMDQMVALNDPNGRTQAEYLDALRTWSYTAADDRADDPEDAGIVAARYSVMENAMDGVSIFILYVGH